MARLAWFAAGVVAGAVWTDIRRSGVLAEIVEDWSESLDEALAELAAMSKAQVRR